MLSPLCRCSRIRSRHRCSVACFAIHALRYDVVRSFRLLDPSTCSSACAYAHEVNQPLHAIANYALACLKTLEQIKSTELDEVRGWMQAISQESHRAAGILRGIRQFVRRQEPSRDAHDLNPLLEEALDLLEFEIRRWHVKVIKDLSVPSPRVFVDRLQIQQVAVNLVRNAIEAMQTTDPLFRELTVATVVSESQVEVVIRDRGAGILDAEQLFKPFFTTKPQGLGMGLAVSHTIIRAHGGQIWSTSPAGGGASLHFTIPRAERAPT